MKWDFNSRLLGEDRLLVPVDTHCTIIFLADGNKWCEWDVPVLGGHVLTSPLQSVWRDVGSFRREGVYLGTRILWGFTGKLYFARVIVEVVSQEEFMRRIGMRKVSL